MPEVVAEKPKVVDLMAALEASVHAAKDARARHPAAHAESTEQRRCRPKPAKIGKAAAKSTKPAKLARHPVEGGAGRRRRR